MYKRIRLTLGSVMMGGLILGSACGRGNNNAADTAGMSTTPAGGTGGTGTAAGSVSPGMTGGATSTMDTTRRTDTTRRDTSAMKGDTSKRHDTTARKKGSTKRRP